MNQGKLFEEILNPVNRPNPYPLYAQLRKTPISQQEDGTYVVSTYREIEALLYDPRISSDQRKSTRGVPLRFRVRQGPEGTLPFILLDPPDHNRLRRVVMHQFTHERVERMRDLVIQIVKEFLDAQRNRSQLDIVDDFAHPLPVRVISKMLGVPIEDRARIEAWVSPLIRTIEPPQNVNETEGVDERASQAAIEMREYLRDLIIPRRDRPGRDDLISALVMATSREDAGQMNEQEFLSSLLLLVIAGYETTVNLITNSMLTLLRHPDVLARLCRDPDNMVGRTVEEVLRYEPAVHYINRTSLADINIGGVTIPKGATVILLLASGSRDPARFADPDRFEPDRIDNEHLGFGRGIHYCVGAPLARMETHIALSALASRLVNPHLVTDPPPYRELALLRGSLHLAVAFDDLVD
jgi:cytochrome P450